MTCKFSARFGYYIFTSLVVVNLVELLASRYPVIAYARFLPESDNDGNDPVQQLRALLSELGKADNQLYLKDDASNVRELDSIMKKTPLNQNEPELNLVMEWNASELGSHATVHKSPHHHHHRHRRHHHKKRRRSLESINTSSNNQQPYLIAKNGAIVKRSKHLMLAKPYWPWP